jgi:hypothetical protein
MPQAVKHTTRCSTRHPNLVCAAVAVSLVLVAQGAVAQATDQRRTGTLNLGKATGTATAPGPNKAQGPLLTRAELRECLNLQPRLRSLSDEVVAAQAALDKQKAELVEHGAALKEQLAALDRTSAEAVDAYNKRVQEHEQRVDAYNAQTPVFNAKVEHLQAQRSAFAKGCENRDFDEKDEIAIRKGQ